MERDVRTYPGDPATRAGFALSAALRASYAANDTLQAELDALRLAGEWKPTHRHIEEDYLVRVTGRKEGIVDFTRMAEMPDYQAGSKFDAEFEPIPETKESEAQ